MGEPAQYSVTGRDFAGGMAGVVFRVDGPGEVARVDYTVDALGTVRYTAEPCTTLTAVDTFDPRPICG